MERMPVSIEIVNLDKEGVRDVGIMEGERR
jgi:hypothetical protein